MGKNNGGGKHGLNMEGRCFNEVHPDSRVLVYSSASLRDLVYGATQLRELFYCRAYMVIQCSDPICSAEEWCTTEDRMKAPPGDHLLPQCSVTQCNSSTHEAKFRQNKRSFHCFIARMNTCLQKNRMLSFARDNKKGRI